MNDKYEAQIVSLEREKEVLDDTSARDKEELRTRYEQQIATINSERKAEINALNDKYEAQIESLEKEKETRYRKGSFMAAHLREVGKKIDEVAAQKRASAERTGQ